MLAFGEDAKGHRGVITVARPAPQDLPQDPARAKDLVRGLKFGVKVKNTSQQALQANEFSFTATVGENPAKLVVDDASKAGDKLKADILPGKEGTVDLLVPVPSAPSDVTIKVQFGRAKPLYWNGKA
ncbi:hypothetical protein [Amycolatopsis sp. Poz14]|uniref:hypothetical protein n=1 Tax=Amycolatopsis sp. Poz14 TaxID=1447705 RepID=UPI001EE78D06|nr:hypothetical protein [Amycolatopsis sp. Poz14]MCG3752607.1 hypothetical protein [Amycolatopsis sp. Poz14]